MELRHLRYFAAVAAERHITRAAFRLGMQQPPLSLQIRQLETELGVTLFDRTPRGVELTPAGQAFLADATAILAAVQAAATRSAQVARGQVGRLAIGFTTSAILHPIVARMVRAFRQAYPDVTLDLRENNAATLTQAVADGTLTAAVIRIPVQRPAGMAFDELLHEELLVALPSGHRLCSRPVRLADLSQERFILVRQPGAPGIYGNVVAACRAAGFEPIIAAEVPHMLTNVNLVAAGVGISVVPASMNEIRRQDVSYSRLRGRAKLTAPLTLAHMTATTDPVLPNFLRLARELAAAK